MPQYDRYGFDPSYTIGEKLSEYCEMVCEHEDHYYESIIALENELKEAINDYCMIATDDFCRLTEQVHDGMATNSLDICELEEAIALISNTVRIVCERRENGSRIYHQIQGEEYEASHVSMSNMLEYNPYQRSVQDFVFDDGEERYLRSNREKARQHIISQIQFTTRQKASAIYQYIASQTRPVSKENVAMMVAGYSNRALAIAVSRKDILNYRGLYFCIKHIGITIEDGNNVSYFLNRELSDGKTYHIDDLYDAFVVNFPSLISRAYVNSPYQLFSLLEAVFADKYNFSRPFIAARWAHIRSPQEHLKEYISNNAEFPVSDFVAYARERHLQVHSILELIGSLDNYVLLKNRETIIQISHTGITENIAIAAIRMIKNEVVQNLCMAIRDLDCLSKLPTIKLPWNEWLVYSVVRKWGTDITVHTTSRQFRQSIPIISIRGAATEERITAIAKKCADASYVPSEKIIEDLDDLDDLILGYVDLDIDLDLDFDLEEGNDE